MNQNLYMFDCCVASGAILPRAERLRSFQAARCSVQIMPFGSWMDVLLPPFRGVAKGAQLRTTRPMMFKCLRKAYEGGYVEAKPPQKKSCRTSGTASVSSPKTFGQMPLI